MEVTGQGLKDGEGVMERESPGKGKPLQWGEGQRCLQRARMCGGDRGVAREEGGGRESLACREHRLCPTGPASHLIFAVPLLSLCCCDKFPQT